MIFARFWHNHPVMSEADVLVVGAGPNGLSAAIAAARAGHKVLVLEEQPAPGGAVRTEELTLPGFLHDTGSAVHPLAALSPFFRSLPLEQYGLTWVHPEIPLAHPLPDGSCAVLLRSIPATAARLGADAAAYKEHMRNVTAGFLWLFDELPRGRFPAAPMSLPRFAVSTLMPASSIAFRWFQSEDARALIAGLAAHASLPLDASGSGAVALALAAATHTVGLPFPQGGAEQITRALVACLQSMGGEIQTNSPVRSFRDLPAAKTVFWDISPRQLLAIAGDALPASYRRALSRYRYGFGACKVDWALAGPIPWLAEECRKAGTVHLGGSFEEIAASEASVGKGVLPGRPYVLLAQPTVSDPTRAPAGRHTAWAYCHVPNGSSVSMAEAIEEQVERFAPGFRTLILGRCVLRAPELEQRDANLVGGDVGGGLNGIRQLIFRPTPRIYSIPLRGHYLCSASTLPGGGVHGMCGYLAARLALGRKITLQRRGSTA